MMNQTLGQLRQLKLHGMASALQLQSEQPGNYDNLSFEERIAMMADSEQHEREIRKQERLLKAAKLKIHANAILDRLMHNAHRINLKGESMRKIRSELT